jgi:hypothetical protein
MAKLKCECQWINERGEKTPDTNNAVAIAIHYQVLLSNPGSSFKVLGYSDKVSQRFPICQAHLDEAKRLGLDMSDGWKFISLGE